MLYIYIIYWPPRSLQFWHYRTWTDDPFLVREMLYHWAKRHIVPQKFLIKISRVGGIEPPSKVLKTLILPLNYTPHILLFIFFIFLLKSFFKVKNRKYLNKKIWVWWDSNPRRIFHRIYSPAPLSTRPHTQSFLYYKYLY